MRLRRLVVAILLGGILGAGVAYVGATRIFVCRGVPGGGIVSCAEPDALLALAWGVPLGVLVGLVAGLAPRETGVPRLETPCRRAAG